MASEGRGSISDQKKKRKRKDKGENEENGHALSAEFCVHTKTWHSISNRQQQEMHRSRGLDQAPHSRSLRPRSGVVGRGATADAAVALEHCRDAFDLQVSCDDTTNRSGRVGSMEPLVRDTPPRVSTSVRIRAV